MTADPPPPARRPPALVVGAGLVGRAIALCLQRRGIETVLVDPDPEPRGASWGNAGHVAVEQVEPLASPAAVRSAWRRLYRNGGALALPPREIATWLPFAVRLVASSTPARAAAGRAALTSLLELALPAWRRLTAAAGVPELLREDGHVVVWESAATARAGRRAWLDARIPTARLRDLEAEELRGVAALGQRALAGGLRFEGTGQVTDLAVLAAALGRAFREAGGTCVPDRAVELATTGASARVRLERGGWMAPALLVIAAGARSGALLRTAGLHVPLIAERGYHLRSAPGPWPATAVPVVYEDRSLIVTRYRDCVQAASFVEFARAEAPPDPGKWSRLERHVRELGLPFAPEPRRWTGARPTLPDYLPAIGRSRVAGNLVHAYGHQHLGLTLAALTGEAVAALAAGVPPPFDLAPVAPTRFGRL